MTDRMTRRLVLVAALALGVARAPSYAAPVNAAARLPGVMLWAWERPEDFRGVGSDAGVAFLAQTITLDGNRVTRRPRMQPLRVDASTMLVAVTRIETRRQRRDARVDTRDTKETKETKDAFDPPDLPGPVVDSIVRTAALPQVAGVQVDFDAAASERPLYRAILERLRARLPRATVLSITALASWCAADGWLGDLPIDEAIPMLFRMGPFNEPDLHAIDSWPRPFPYASHRPTRALCGRAVGLSLDEPRAIDAAGRRVYVFNPKPWTARTIADVRREARR
jgi:hypothetical protein